MACNEILIVEDERDARESLAQLLELEGFSAVLAENGAEGLRALASIEQPCLILLDLMMPVMNGWQFMEVLSTQHKDVLARAPVVVISAAADVGRPLRALGCAVMQKPLDVDKLIDIVREHCGGHA